MLPHVQDVQKHVPSQSMNRLEPQTGTAFELMKGQLLRVSDLEGEQVADLIAFSRLDKAEWLSSGRSIDYANRIYLTKGDLLYSNRSRPMFTIVEDDVGRHDFLLTPCSPETFQIIYKNAKAHPSCFNNLATHLAPFGIAGDSIPTTFNIFMNVEIDANGVLKILPPPSKAGDSIVLRAEMDLIVGLTACSAEMSNNYRFKPIGYEIS
jgi:uncharacterized protein YcgI (DUF1989 family)